MLNRTVHTTPVTKNGSSETWSSNKESQTVDDTKETISAFHAKVDAALANKDRWVETSPEVLKYLYPRGLGVLDGKPVEHACYRGVLVCEFGQSENIEAKMKESLNKRMHGSSEGTVVSG